MQVLNEPVGIVEIVAKHYTKPEQPFSFGFNIIDTKDDFGQSRLEDLFLVFLGK